MKKKKKFSPGRLVVTIVLVLFILAWVVPSFGVFVTSFRDPADIYASGWWSVLPHRENVKTREITLPDDLDPDQPITIEGYTASFAEWREGIAVTDEKTMQWYGNKRSRRVDVFERTWVGFGANLTLGNYRDVLTGGTITFTDATGNTITREGNNFSSAVLNSIAVSVPATIIPILIAAFAAYAFAWMNFPGRKPLFVIVCRAAGRSPADGAHSGTQDFTRWGLTGSFVSMCSRIPDSVCRSRSTFCTNYISTLPRDVFESAYIDGATPFKTFMWLVLPHVGTGACSFAIFQFLWVWNDYLVALIFLGDRHRVVTFTCVHDR